MGAIVPASYDDSEYLPPPALRQPDRSRRRPRRRAREETRESFQPPLIPTLPPSLASLGAEPRPARAVPRADVGFGWLALLFTLSLPVLAVHQALETVENVRQWSRLSPWRLAAYRAVVSAAAVVLFAVGLAWHYVYLNEDGLPYLEPFIAFEPPTTGQVYDANGEALIELAREYRRILRYQDVPPVIRQAVLAAEDKHFFSHQGVDYSAFPRILWKAAVHSWAASRGGHLTIVMPQGGSTLTQQLVRTYFLEDVTRQERGSALLKDNLLTRLAAHAIGVPNTNKLIRKVEEIRLTFWIERELRERYGSQQKAKEAILARYASFVYLGNGRYGFEAASEYYFGRPLASYTLADADKAALLAGITKSPREYAPGEESDLRPLRRRNDILDLMAEEGYLSRDAARRFKQTTIALAEHARMKTIAPAVVEDSLGEIRRYGRSQITIEQLFEGRIQVHSTVDVRLQKLVNRSLENGLQAYEERHPESAGLIQGSVVVLRNRDGAILAESGGREVYQGRLTTYSDFNRVTDSRRQPGSAMKPIVYLTAFMNGFSLESRVPDAPIAVPMGSHQPAKWIQNYDHKFKGVIPVRQALAESRNACTIWVAKQVGIERVLETAQSLGIQSKLQPYITTALGASEVGLVELANVYRTIASGVSAEPHIIDKITDPTGQVVFSPDRRLKPAPVSEAALERIREGLRGVIRVPGGTAHSLDGFPIPVMGKTGTTSSFRDALFVGSTFGPDGVTVAVRLGFDDNRELGDKETGGKAALPVFKEILQHGYADGLLGEVPTFPEEIEEHIDAYLHGRSRAEAGETTPEGELPLLPAEPVVPALSEPTVTVSSQVEPE